MLTLTCHKFSYRGRGIFLSSDLFVHRQDGNTQVLNLKSKAALRLAGWQDTFFWKGTGSRVVMYCGMWWCKVRILGRDSNQVIALWPKLGDFGSDVHLFGKQHLFQFNHLELQIRAASLSLTHSKFERPTWSKKPN